jgi:outer membrane protein OmpA-like peptidoglycan-associated protein
MKRVVLGLLAVLCVFSANAETFRFQYHNGDLYRYYGSTAQRIYVNKKFAQSNFQEYRVSYSVSEADDKGGRLDGHTTVVTHPGSNTAGAVSEDYDTSYHVDVFGAFVVPGDQIMPVVRNVPTFPLSDLKPGDTWTGTGEELHDLRADFGVDRLLRIPFAVSYTYQGTTVRDGKTLYVIQSDYRLDTPTGFQSTRDVYPVRFSGVSHQFHYFNLEKGREEGYEETYDLKLTMNTGVEFDYVGKGSVFLVEAKAMDKPAVADEIKKGLEQSGLGNVEVKTVPRGVTINLDNIHFPGDSADLVASEQQKLKLIGDILKQYPDRDILVEGHTADVAGGKEPQQLSEDRAAAVGNFLLSLGVRQPNQISYRGWGATKPLAPNDTEEHRAKNRRVEITILEN